MHIARSTLKFEELQPVALSFTAAQAANEPLPCPQPPSREESVELNELLVRVCEHVATNTLQSPSVVLSPLDSVLNVLGDDETLAFVVSGLLAAGLRDRNSGAVAQLRLNATLSGDELVLSVHAENPPPPSVVKAIESEGGDGDPTVAHCKRLVEGAGGHLRLTSERQSSGVSLHLPLDRLASADNAASAEANLQSSQSTVLAS